MSTVLIIIAIICWMVAMLCLLGICRAASDADVLRESVLRRHRASKDHPKGDGGV